MTGASSIQFLKRFNLLSGLGLGSSLAAWDEEGDHGPLYFPQLFSLFSSLSPPSTSHCISYLWVLDSSGLFLTVIHLCRHKWLVIASPFPFLLPKLWHFQMHWHLLPTNWLFSYFLCYCEFVPLKKNKIFPVKLVEFGVSVNAPP